MNRKKCKQKINFSYLETPGFCSLVAKKAIKQLENVITYQKNVFLLMLKKYAHKYNYNLLFLSSKNYTYNYKKKHFV